MRAPRGGGPRPTLDNKNSLRWEPAVISLSRGSPPPSCHAGPSEEATPGRCPNSAPLNTLLEEQVPARTMDRTVERAFTSRRHHPWASLSSELRTHSA